MALNIFTMFDKTQRKQKPTKGSAPESNKTPAQVLAEGMVNVRDIIAPSALEVDFSFIKIGNTFFRTLFVSGYPRFVGANWLSPIINFDHSLDLSMFYYPVKSKMILDDLRRKITELEATIMQSREKGKLVDPVVSAALEDANALQEQLVKGVEKYFKFSFYITIPADSQEELENVTSRLESTLGSLLLISKTATLQMEDAFQSAIPCGLDKLLITRNMDTTSLATTFPFTSSDLTMEEGIMYGINRHNGSLIIFERFSLENANTVVFAKSGSGKSYFVKLEALRLMVFGAEVMIIDPEEEYRPLCDAVGGNYIDFSAGSPAKINPFDLSGIAVEGENELGQKMISLVTLFKLMLGGLTPTEEALLDRALIETYRIKGITSDPETQMSREPPVMEDLYKVLLGMDEPEARSMAERLEKFVKGSMTGIFDSQSNIDLNSRMTVFSTKNLEEALRSIAFYIILDFIWTRIRKELKKRILIVEEAWYLLQNEDSARFIYGIAKRARKYYLGLTTISQDVDEFLSSEYGKAVVTNSSIQVLLKQHPAAIDKVAEAFYLSEGEKRLLLSAGVGEGLFFAGSNHVAMKVMASEAEDRLITTNPEEILKLRAEGVIKPKQPQVRATHTQYVPQSDPNKYETFDKAGNVKPEYSVPTKSQPAAAAPSQPVKPATPVSQPFAQPVKPVSAVPPAPKVEQKPEDKKEVPGPDHMPTPDEIIKSVQDSVFKSKGLSTAPPAPFQPQNKPNVPPVTNTQPQQSQQSAPQAPRPVSPSPQPSVQQQQAPRPYPQSAIRPPTTPSISAPPSLSQNKPPTPPVPPTPNTGVNTIKDEMSALGGQQGTVDLKR
jgi:conjugal transfer ATP-binding protein TraC